jgi:predicted DNA-binding protein
VNEDFGAVRIPKELIERIAKRLPQTDFRTVDEYIEYIIENVLNEVTGEEDQETGRASSPSDSESEEKIRKRLKALGYIR